MVTYWINTIGANKTSLSVSLDSRLARENLFLMHSNYLAKHSTTETFTQPHSPSVINLMWEGPERLTMAALRPPSPPRPPTQFGNSQEYLPRLIAWLPQRR